MASEFNLKNTPFIIKILVSVLVLVCIIIVFFTFYVFFTGGPSPERKFDSSGLTGSVSPSPEDNGIFTGIGTLRVLTAGEPAFLVIINPVFYYDKDGFEFFEELQRKRSRLERIVRDWVSSNTGEYFLETSDEKLRSDLAGLLSEILILGSVENLYFSEFLVVDGNL